MENPGNVPPIHLAPLRGVTIATFRRAFAESFGGVASALSPFVALGAPDKAPPLKLLADVLPEACGAMPVVPQVIGKDPAALRPMASALRDLGYTHMNLNCGCPWKFVAKKGRGSGLPENEAAFARMLEAGCEAMPGGFSIKIRLGYSDAGTLEKRAALINSFPLESVTVHPRTGVQMYGGAVDLERFHSALHLLKAPVIYNGDIFTAEDARRVLKRFPAISGMMIGRGLCRNPCLAEEILSGGIDDGEKRRRAAAFAKTLAENYARELCGPAPLMGRLKELWGYLHASFENGDDGLKRIQRSRTVDELFAAIDGLTGRIQG